MRISKENFEKLKQYFEEDLASVLPTMCKEYSETSGSNDSDFKEMFQVRTIENENNILEYSILDEPYIRVRLDFNLDKFTAIQANQLELVKKFKTNSFEHLIREFNFMLEYYSGYSVEFPKLPDSLIFSICQDSRE